MRDDFEEGMSDGVQVIWVRIGLEDVNDIFVGFC
jgi:hypothetical protein